MENDEALLVCSGPKINIKETIGQHEFHNESHDVQVGENVLWYGHSTTSGKAISDQNVIRLGWPI